jgi:ABC-type enterochelin transport system permease subunit
MCGAICFSFTSQARFAAVDSKGVPNAAKIGIGVVLLLMLFSAELRLNFGLRFDTVITLAGIWVFWHYCLRVRNVAV